MALEVNIHLISSEVSGKRGETVECGFDVENTSDRPITVGLEPLGERKAWVKLDEVELVLPPKALQRVTARISVPVDAATQPTSFRLRAYDERAPMNAVESSAVAIVVEPLHTEPLPPPPQPRRWKLIAAVVGGLLLVAGIVGAVVWAVSGSEVPDVTMVDERPAMLNEALEILDEAGLAIGTVTEDVSELPAGAVVSQSPPAGTKVDDDTVVDLTIAMVSVEVPSVIALTVAAARNRLTEAGLDTETRTEVTGNSPGGTVIGQEPAPGSRAIPSSLVTLVVEKELVEVPDLAGATLDAANQRLQERGLAVAQRSVVNTGAAPGTVVGQEPAAGMRVDRGTTVAVDLETARIEVPSVVGLTLDEAVRRLGGAQLLVAPVRPAYLTRGPFGTVSGQNPAAGAQVPPGTGVTLSVRTQAVFGDRRPLELEVLQNATIRQLVPQENLVRPDN